MTILQYLQPDNPIALAIVYILNILFLVWFGKLLFMGGFLIYQRKQISKCGDVDSLADKLVQILNPKEEKKKKRGREKKDNPEPEETEDLPSPLITGESAFLNFCSQKNIKEKGIVTRHLRAIFDAGLKDSRLDIGELIKHTTNSLFRGNAFLKSLLASFIVLGLLGTLVGLADSLAGLSPVLGEGAVEKTSADLSSGLSVLFGHLKTAFAPSIWGVTFTVFGVLIFSLYLRMVCFPVKNIIENRTLTIWVPKLFLTAPQRLLGTLKVSEDQIQKNLDTIHDVIEVQKTVREDVEELGHKLKDSNQTLGRMTESANKIQNFTDSFVDGVKTLSSFQHELQTLYKNMADESQAFQQRVQKSIEDSKEFQENADTTFQNQNQQLQEGFRNLNSYEEAYIEQRREIDSKIQELLESARKAYESLGERNNEVLDAIGRPLQEQLSEIRGALNQELADIARRFDAFDVPIRAASERIAITVETFDARTTTLKTEMNNVFTSLYEKNYEGLNELYDKVDGYSNQLSETNRNQAEHSRTLGENVSALSGNIASMNDSFKSFDQFTRSEKEKANKHMVELTKELQKEFATQNKETNKYLEKLFKKFENYDDELKETRDTQVEQGKTLERNLSALTDAVGSLGGSIRTLENLSKKRDEGLEKLQPLADLSQQMGSLVSQLKDGNRIQEKQSQAMAKRIDLVAGVVKLLAKSISEQTGKEVPKEYMNPEKGDYPPPPGRKGGFLNFFKRIFDK